MLNAATIEQIARGYHTAEKQRERMRPPSVVYPGFTTEDAYAVQRKWVELKLAEGNRIKGHKIGLTSRAMQRQANITEPDYGALMRGFLDGLPEGGVVMCHPGFVDDLLLSLDHMTTVREIEHAYLASAAFAELLTANKVTLS